MDRIVENQGEFISMIAQEIRRDEKIYDDSSYSEENTNGIASPPAWPPMSPTGRTQLIIRWARTSDGSKLPSFPELNDRTEA